MSEQLELREPDFLAKDSGFYIRLNVEKNGQLDRLSNYHVKVIKEIIFEGIKTHSIFTLWVGIPKESGEDDTTKFEYVEEKQLELKAEDFYNGKWVNKLGSNYVTYPLVKGQTVKYLSLIAQIWRKQREIKRMAGVIGFKKDSDNLIYISGNDIIGDKTGIEVKPIDNHKASKYGLKLDSDKLTLEESFKNSLSFLTLAHPEISIPLYASIWRAPLCYWRTFPSLVTIVGKTGSLKSTICAKALSHFGDFFDNTDLPIKWIDTFTAIQIQLATLHDTLIVIDDFNPEFGKNIKDSMASTLSLIIGDISDGISKKRASYDLTLRDPIITRGVMVSTNEELPELPESRLARLLVIQMDKEVKVYVKKLDKFDTNKNLVITRKYIEWLRQNEIEIQKNLNEQFRFHRAYITDLIKTTIHKRSIDTYAELMLGVDYFIKFCSNYNLTLPSTFYKLCQDTISELIQKQNVESLEDVGITESDQFCQELGVLIDFKQACLFPKLKSDAIIGNEYKDCIGWYDTNYVYLHFRKAVYLVNMERHKVGKQPFNYRVIANNLMAEKYTEEIATLVKINNSVYRLTKIGYNKIFPSNT